MKGIVHFDGNMMSFTDPETLQIMQDQSDL